jgi:hypothetical protein
MVLLFCSPGFSQQVKPEERATITLCWHTTLDTSARYLIYFNRYLSADTVWRLIGTTKNTTFDVAKETFKGDIAFGVKTVYFNDTSALHTSLEPSACVSSINNSCDTTCTQGPWYISWHIMKPDRISIINK